MTQNTSDLTITGRGEAGATVHLYDNGERIFDDIVGDNTVGDDGIFSIDLPLMTEGPHDIKAMQTDLAGNESAFSYPSLYIRIDTTKPSPPFVFGSTPTNNPTPTWEWFSRGGGNGRYRHKLNDGDWSSEVLNTRYTPEALRDGRHTLYVQEYDDAGNWSDSESFVIAIDTIPLGAPSGLDLSAEDDTGDSASDNLTKKNYGLTITGSGENGAIVQLYSDGDQIFGGADTVAGGRFSINISLPEGTHAVTATQTDTVGNTSGPSSPLTIKVDTIAPFGRLTITDNQGYIRTDTVNLTIFSEEAEQMRFAVNNAGELESAAWLPLAENHSVNIASEGEGEVWILVQFRDKAGNIRFDPSYDSTYYDITPPNPPYIWGDTPTNDPTPSWEWAGGGGGIRVYRYKLNNGDMNSGASETLFTTYMPVQNLSNGIHTLHLQERDMAGNWSDTRAFTIKVDTSMKPAPKVTGPVVTNNLTPTWRWFSSGHGNGSFRFRLDDTPWSTSVIDTSHTPTSVLSEGIHILSVQEYDDPGNLSAVGSWKIEIDSGLPCSQAKAPSAVDDQNLTFIVTYTSDDAYTGEPCGSGSSGSGLDRVELYAKTPGDDEFHLVEIDSGDEIDGEFAYTVGEPGEYFLYTLAADTAGNTEDPPDEYDTRTVYSSAFSGYAILAVGSIDREEGIEAHTLAANNIYTHLINRGFALIDDSSEKWNDPLDNIKYYNPYDETQTGEDDYSEEGSYWLALQNAITQWAPEKMRTLPGPLFIILLDHGSPDTFYLSGTAPVSSKNLDDWLNTLQEKMDAEGMVTENPETGEKEPPPIVVIFGACYSGSFIDNLSGPGRIIVASSAADEPSYRGPINPYSGVRDGEFFTSTLLNELAAGHSLKAAFERAVAQAEAYTDSGTGKNSIIWSDTATQHPLLDDNEDGDGSNNLAVSGSDGAKAKNIFLGRGTGVLNPVTVTEAGTVPNTPPPLGFFENHAILWAEVSDTARTQSVWVEIREPDMILEQEGENQQTLELVSIALEPNESGSRYEAVHSDFSVSGDYTLFFYAKDTSGIISTPETKWLYKDKPSVPGDVSGDGLVNLTDAIFALKIVCGAGNVAVTLSGDVNRDGKIGLEDASFILRKLAEF
ncbi:Ig-like domain-containing protein [Desulfococcaceae bacterium HSG8]|nr:Ig-like domain-containing protein [Desulfococcaceae bacterium HSG8]